MSWCRMLPNFSPVFVRGKALAWGLYQIVKAAPREFISLFSLTLVQGAVAGATLFVIQETVDGLIALQNGADFITLLMPLMFWGLLLLIEMTSGPIVSLLRINLNEKVLTRCNLLLMQKVNSLLGLESFENPTLHAELAFLKNEAQSKPLNFVYVITGFFKELTSLLSILLVISTVSWWIPVIICFCSLPHAYSLIWLERQSWDLALFKSAEMRRMQWCASTAFDARAAKEIRIFKLGDFFEQRYRELAQSFHDTFQPMRVKACTKSLFLSLITVVGHLVTIGWIIVLVKQGSCTAGSTVMLFQAILLTQHGFANFMLDIGMVLQPILFFVKMNSFLKTSFSSIQTIGLKKSISKIEQSIVFENVSFRYPDGKIALQNISLTITAGDRIAIVGENGAGKTTLIKLLLRFYDPTEGRILIDGVDLKEFDLTSWRQCCSAIFQDFHQFHLTLRENIALGSLDHLQDTQRLDEACLNAGFVSVVRSLSHGYETLLGKEFAGTELSGGQWQKLALARTFFKEAAFLILDEPSASLDPKSESELFQKFSQLAAGKTVLYITHRLASVEKADKIIVLKNAQLIEEGRHDELIYHQGEYVKLFESQIAEPHRLLTEMQTIADALEKSKILPKNSSLFLDNSVLSKLRAPKNGQIALQNIEFFESIVKEFELSLADIFLTERLFTEVIGYGKIKRDIENLIRNSLDEQQKDIGNLIQENKGITEERGRIASFIDFLEDLFYQELKKQLPQNEIFSITTDRLKKYPHIESLAGFEKQLLNFGNTLTQNEPEYKIFIQVLAEDAVVRYALNIQTTDNLHENTRSILYQMLQILISKYYSSEIFHTNLNLVMSALKTHVTHNPAESLFKKHKDLIDPELSHFPFYGTLINGRITPTTVLTAEPEHIVQERLKYSFQAIGSKASIHGAQKLALGKTIILDFEEFSFTVISTEEFIRENFKSNSGKQIFSNA